MQNLHNIIILILTTVLIFPAFGKVQAAEKSELIRASVIEKVAQFIEWPTIDQKQFTICAFRGTSLLPALKTYYENSFIDKTPVQLLSVNNIKDFTECKIIYLGVDDSVSLENILKIVNQQPILIITEKKNDVIQGAHVDFFIEDNRLRLEVNRTALSMSHLQASYHLLGVARIVD